MTLKDKGYQGMVADYCKEAKFPDGHYFV